MRRKLADIATGNRILRSFFARPFVCMGVECRPLEETLQACEKWVADQLPKIEPALLHGDPHLGNVFLSSEGRARFIDPNPEACIGDPMYDYGKLLHWIEPVGWAAVDPRVCMSRLIGGGSGRNPVPQLTAWLSNRVPTAPERRRRWAEEDFRERFSGESPDRRARLALATATAHVGLARLLSKRRRQGAALFVLAHALRSLAEWEQIARP